MAFERKNKRLSAINLDALWADSGKSEAETRMAKKQQDAIPEDIAALNFEQAMSALEEIVRQLEGGDIGLEESIECYARGAMLKRHCEEKLRAASEKIEKIVLNENGQVGTVPADAE